MYVGSHYNNYYNTLFGGVSSLYGSSKASSSSSNILSFLKNSQLKTNSVSTSAIDYVTNIKSGASGVSSALSSLKTGAAFRQKGLVSSDSDVMTVSSGSKASAADAELSVMVEQVATGQVNEGAALSAKGTAGSRSQNQFAVEINGKTHSFSVDVAAGDTNTAVQQKMADAINARGIGLNASVSTNSADGTSTLRIAAKGTGEDAANMFKVRDTRGDLVSKTGANNIVQDAGDAKYSINGGATQTSKSNEISLGKGITGTLKKASSKPVEVKVDVDVDYSVAKLRELVDSYNTMYSATLESTDTKSNRLFSQMLGVSKTYASGLSKVGVGFDDNGKMTIDSDKLKSAAADGSLQSFFADGSGSNYGFANRLDRLASNVTNNTSMYVDKSFFQSSLMDSMGYSNIGALNQYVMQSSGWMLDYLL